MTIANQETCSCRNRTGKVLITGGLGFLGLNIARELLGHNWSVSLFDNLSSQIHGVLPRIDDKLTELPNVEIIRGDVNVRGSVLRALDGVDSVIHLAAETGTAQSMYQIEHYSSVNTQATAMLMDILVNESHSVSKVVLASSRSIYGEGAYLCKNHGSVYPSGRMQQQLTQKQWDLVCPNCNSRLDVIPTNEDAPSKPASIYAATKLAQEDLVRVAGSALGIGTVILRMQNVYGAGQSLNNPYTGILSIFSTRIRRGKSLPIFEDGFESRDFVHVSDVARAFRLSLESEAGNGMTFNVGSGKAASVMAVAELLVKLLGGKNEPEVTGQYRLGDIRHCYADLSMITSILGFKPEIDLDDGLLEFVNWALSQPLPEDGLDKANSELKIRNMMS